MSRRRDATAPNKSDPTIASLVGDAVVLAQNAALAPLRLTLSWTSWLASAATPPLIPLAVLAILTPILLFMSLATGFYVWKSGAVGWLAILDLQYGYVRVFLVALGPAKPHQRRGTAVCPNIIVNYELG